MDRTHNLALALLLAAMIPFASGCSDDTGGDTQETSTPDSDSTNNPTEPTAATGNVRPEVINAAHILIMYQGSERARSTVTRTKEEALALANEVAEKAKQEGADFAELAKEYSDGPSGPGGGNLGNFSPDRMVRPFSEAALKLAEGEVSGPVETEFGYHIIRRQPVQVVKKASAKHILVMHKDSRRAPETVTRTKEEALARAEELLERAKKGENFDDLAREHSDGPSSSRGGDLGEFTQGSMVPPFDEAVFNGEVGELTDIVETPFGYHIIYRYK